MEPDRWKRLQEIFDGALKRHVADREAYLDEQCAGDSELLDHARLLLAADGGREHRLSDALAPGLPEETRATETARVGQRLGPYRIRKELGHGGMGTVYLADRADDEFRKQVAIKVVRGGLDSPELLARFRTERQILASLEHPNVARLLDGGTTGDGLPFVVIEYVEGEPVTDFCDQRSLRTRDRVRLFRKICSAVDFAHRNLIVHRDLKPGNILVTSDGTPKLLDFGIAKLLGPVGDLLGTTRTGMRLLTPEYASPEQMRAEPVTTASDVYSLGVVLYELLSGRHPYGDARNPGELERLVRETDPEPPSTAVTRSGSPDAGQADRIAGARATDVHRLRRELSGDLDNIVLAALRKEPSRRYGTARELSDDLGRYLDGLPVAARPATLGYRSRKFLRRNAGKVAVVAGALVLLTASTIVASTLYLRADRALREARTQRETSDRVSSFLQGMLAAANPHETQTREDVTVRQVLDDARERLPHDLADQPRVAATLLGTIASSYLWLTQFEQSESAYREAMEFLRASGDMETDDAVELQLKFGAALRQWGKHDEASRVLEAVHAACARSRPGTAELVRAKRFLADTYVSAGHYDDAEAMYLGALEILDGGEVGSDEDLGATLTSLGMLNQRQGKLTDAERHVRAALERLRAHFGEEHSSTARAWNNLGFVLEDLHGATEEVVTCFRRSLAILTKVFAEDHPQVAVTRGNLALAYADLGRFEEARTEHEGVIGVFEQSYGEGHQMVGHARNNFAMLLLDIEDNEGAREQFARAEEIYQGSLGPKHPYVAVAKHNRAVALRRMGRLQDAEALCRQSLKLRREVLQPDHPDIARSTQLLGSIHVDRGEWSLALSLLEDAMDVLRESFPPSHEMRTATSLLLGQCLAELGRYEEAEPLLLRTLAVHDSLGSGGGKEATRVREILEGLPSRPGVPPER